MELMLGLITVGLSVGMIILGLKIKSAKTVYMGNPKEVELTKDVTTIHPLPFLAATCAHNWDVVDDKMLDLPHEKKHVLVLQCRTCGTLDKTVAVTSPAPKVTPPPPVPPTPCHHNWETVVNTTLDAGHEQKIIAILTCKLCGKIDKTTEVTSPAPPPLPAPFSVDQCCHKWDVDKKVLLESPYEQMLESIKVRKDNYSGAKKIDPNKALELDLQKAPPWLFHKTYVCVRTCTKCGKLDKTVVSNFDIGKENDIMQEDS
jgi:hypothetical protein